MSTKTYQIKPFEWRYDDEIETHISLNNYRVMRRSDGQHVAFWNGWLVECDSIDHGKQLAEAHHRAELEKHLVEVPAGWFPIETAPKDAAVLVFDGDVKLAWHVQHNSWINSKDGSGWVTRECRSDTDQVYPTHWRPMPSGPNS